MAQSECDRAQQPCHSRIERPAAVQLSRQELRHKAAEKYLLAHPRRDADRDLITEIGNQLNTVLRRRLRLVCLAADNKIACPMLLCDASNSAGTDVIWEPQADLYRCRAPSG